MANACARLAARIIEHLFGVGLRLSVTAGNITAKAKNMETAITEGQSYTLNVGGYNKRRGSIPITGVPSWSSSDPAIVAVTPAEDGLSAQVVANAPGVATITATIDGFSDTDTVTVTADTVLAGIALTASTPA